MTTKTSTSTVPWRAYQTVQYGDGPVQYLSDARGVNTSGWTKVGTTLGNFRKIISTGGHATTNYSVNSTYIGGDNEGTYVYKHVELPAYPPEHPRYDVRYVRGFGYTTPPADPTGLLSGNAEADARIDFLNKVRSQQTAMQGGTFLGELRETIEMIRHPAKALRDGISNYVRAAKKAASRYRTTKQKNRAISGTYLEFQYGWRPLANDIKDAVKAFDQPGGDGSKRVRITSYGHQDTAHSTHMVRNDCVPSLMWDIESTSQVSVKFSGAVWIEPTSHPELRHWGLDATNFLPTVWELIPYSFLVDYFTNIGKIIDAMSVRNYSIIYCTHNRRKSTTNYVNGFQAFDGTGFQIPANRVSIHGTDFGSFAQSENFIRTDEFPSMRDAFLGFHFRIPGISSPWKWLNIGALASQRR